MLSDRPLSPTIPATDIERAKRFYAETLGMRIVRETPGGVEFESGGLGFLVYPTQGPRAEHTLATWIVEDIDAEVAELRARGIVFEDYDFPGLRTVDGIALIEGQERAAWFKDSEGNVLALGEPIA